MDAADRGSPTTASAPCASLGCDPSRSKAWTRWPRPNSDAIRCRPIKPVPPVTNTECASRVTELSSRVGVFCHRVYGGTRQLDAVVPPSRRPPSQEARVFAMPAEECGGVGAARLHFQIEGARVFERGPGHPLSQSAVLQRRRHFCVVDDDLACGQAVLQQANQAAHM